MTADDVIAATRAEDPLRPTVCPRCEYALAGLPAAGICPECGRRYGGAAVYLYGYGAGSKGNAWSGPPATRWGLAVGWISMVVANVLILGGGRANPGRLLPLWILPFGVVSMVVSTWRARTDTGAGLVRVSLGPDGVGQRSRGGVVPFERADRATPVPWSKVRRVRLRLRRGGRVRITLSSTDLWWMWRLDHVDAVVRCPPDRVVALQQRIVGWQAAADRR
jgi:hypothetical protein